MDYSKTFKLGLQMTILLFEAFGINVTERVYRANWRTGFCIFIIAWGNVSVFYTLYIYRKNFAMCLKIFAVAPEAFQGAFQVTVLLKRRKIVASLVEFIKHVFEVNRKVGIHRVHAQLVCANHYKVCLQISVAVLACVVVITTFTPLYSYLILGKKELFYEVYIPGYPPQDRTSTIATYCVQIIQMASAFFGNASFDLILFTLIIHLSLLTGVFEASLKELEELVEKSSTEIKDDEIRRKLRNSAMMHQDLIRYISMTNSTFNPSFVALVAANSFSIAMNLFCMVKTDWLGAYGFALFAFVKMYLICALGTYVEYHSDKMLDAIYHIKWYKLPLDCQRTIFLLLLRSQNFTKLTLANVTPLTVATGAKIMKAIYSYLMVLLSFDE